MTKVINQDDNGKLVATPSGMVLGRIIRVTGNSFLLQEDGGQTTWLADDCVFTNDLRVVTLICEGGRVALYGTESAGTVRPRTDSWRPYEIGPGADDAAASSSGASGTRTRRRNRGARLVPAP